MGQIVRLTGRGEDRRFVPPQAGDDIPTFANHGGKIMSQSPNASVRLKVHLAGAIAYVPEGDGTYWALMPNALLPAPARWRDVKDPNIFRARAPHMGLLMVAKDLIVAQQTTSLIQTVFEQYSSSPSAPSSPTAVMPLVASRLDFGLPSGSLEVKPEVKRDFPQLVEISKPHSRVARKFKPGSTGFEWKSLSASFLLGTGTLAVEGYFGPPGSPKSVDFGYVTSRGKVAAYDKKPVWQREIANELLWEVTLPDGQRSVTIHQSTGDPSKAPTLSALVLQAPKGRNEIEVTIAHAEVDVPMLFLGDPILPADVAALPDPDFEMMYALSSKNGNRSRWRVPIPPPSAGGGLIEKPCTGGMFVGFEG